MNDCVILAVRLTATCFYELCLLRCVAVGIHFVLWLMLLHMLHCVAVSQVGLLKYVKCFVPLALLSLGRCWNYLLDIGPKDFKSF